MAATEINQAMRDLARCIERTSGAVLQDDWAAAKQSHSEAQMHIGPLLRMIDAKQNSRHAVPRGGRGKG
jgi:hypothetical protein